jgi:hypothetical protein
MFDANESGNKWVLGKTRGFSIFPSRIVLVFILVIMVLANAGLSRSHAQSYILEVPYHDQQTSFYCGPAAIKMVMEYTLGIEVSQDALSQEMNTDIEKGITYTSLMDEPFIHRELTDIMEGRTTLNQLKKQITLGHAPILLIWFDERHETGHYVVAVGFNQTGLFVNDPWPTQWSKPVGRETGAYVYLSNEKLLDLWSIHRKWAIIAAYLPSDASIINVDVTISGIPEGLKTTLSLNGESLGVLEPGDTISLLLLDEPHVLSVNTVLYDEEGIGYYCTNNLQQVKNSETLRFAYTLLDR